MTQDYIKELARRALHQGADGRSIWCLVPSCYRNCTHERSDEEQELDDIIIREHRATHYKLEWVLKGKKVEVLLFTGDGYGAAGNLECIHTEVVDILDYEKIEATRYKKTNNGTVVDTQTNLEWQTEAMGPMSWSEVTEHIKSLDDGWRMPTIHELFGLINLARSNPATDFPDDEGHTCWASPADSDITSRVWNVNFNHGDVTSCNKDNSYHIRCVRLIRKGE